VGHCREDTHVRCGLKKGLAMGRRPLLRRRRHSRSIGGLFGVSARRRTWKK